MLYSEEEVGLGRVAEVEEVDVLWRPNGVIGVKSYLCAVSIEKTVGGGSGAGLLLALAGRKTVATFGGLGVDTGCGGGGTELCELPMEAAGAAIMLLCEESRCVIAPSLARSSRLLFDPVAFSAPFGERYLSIASCPCLCKLRMAF